MRDPRPILLGIVCLVMVVSCSDSECDQARIRFAFYRSSLASPIQKDMLHISFSDDLSVKEAHGSEFFTDPDFGHPHSIWYETRTSGTVSVDISLVSESGDTVSHGDMSLVLRPDWQWQIDFHICDNNPLEYCMGCFGHKAFGLKEAYQGSAAESLHVTWGGNSISNPVIY